MLCYLQVANLLYCFLHSPTCELFKQVIPEDSIEDLSKYKKGCLSVLMPLYLVSCTQFTKHRKFNKTPTLYYIDKCYGSDVSLRILFEEILFEKEMVKNF